MTATYSVATYNRLLTLALSEGWRFVNYNQYDPQTGGQALLRHDVDFSVECALKLARQNAAAGVRGTFFVLLRSDVYNLLAPRNLAWARSLADHGQAVGLHYAADGPVPDNLAEVSSAVTRDYELLSDLLPGTVPVFAWHNPGPEWLKKCATLEVSGLINAYAPRYIRDACYRSDSNCRNTPVDFERVLRDRSQPGLHLLFHPVNWVVGGHDMIDILAGTWAQVIKEREGDFLLNRVYQQALPQGMPPKALRDFASHLRTAAIAQSIQLTHHSEAVA